MSVSQDTMNTSHRSAQESPVVDLGHVHHESESPGALLYLKGEYADVKLIVDGQRLPCHKAILASRSEYFRALLYGDMKESKEREVELNVSSVTAFKELLLYIYTGHLCLSGISIETVLEILGLANQYVLSHLQEAISDYLEAILNSRNVYQIFQAAHLYELESLTNTCRSFIDRHAVEILKEDFIYNLPSNELRDLISRDSFCAPEINIFRAVAKWAKQNDQAKEEVVCLIRFSLMSLNDLLQIVRPEEIVSNKVILDAAEVVSGSSRDNLPFRGRLLSEVNIASLSHGAEVISGNAREGLLNDNSNNFRNEACTWHDIGDEEGIIIMLETQSVVNCIKLHLHDNDENSFSYIIQMSQDKKTWEKVVDYKHYVCRSWQELHFATRAVKFIKIVGTWCSSDEGNIFQIASFHCMYTNQYVQLQDDIIVPSENVALTQKHARVIEGRNCTGGHALINGRWDAYVAYHTIGNGAIVVQLAQPYMLDSMRLLLWVGDETIYSYFVEISIDQGKWTTVADKRKEACMSWQNITFVKTPVVYIRITGTNSMAGLDFYCVHLQCPSQDVNQDYV